ncbi:MAG: hypothetical protein ACT6Q3_08295, partial [Sphingopyxis sp.]
VEASAVLFGQTRPARSIVRKIIVRIDHVDTLVKKTAMASTGAGRRPLGSGKSCSRGLPKNLPLAPHFLGWRRLLI